MSNVRRFHFNFDFLYPAVLVELYIFLLYRKYDPHEEQCVVVPTETTFEMKCAEDHVKDAYRRAAKYK